MNTAGLPPIDPAFEPASVRNGSPAAQRAYASALNFESMLVQQLSQSLTESGGLGGGGEGESEGSSGDPVSTQLSSLLPQTLTNSVMSHGGLGMAQQLMGSLLPAGSIPTAAGNAVTVGGGSVAHAPTGSGVASAQVDPTGGVQA